MCFPASWRWAWQSHDCLLIPGSKAVSSVPASTCSSSFSWTKSLWIPSFFYFSWFIHIFCGGGEERKVALLCLSRLCAASTETGTKLPEWERSSGEAAKYLTNTFQRTSGLSFLRRSGCRVALSRTTSQRSALCVAKRSHKRSLYGDWQCWRLGRTVPHPGDVIGDPCFQTGWWTLPFFLPLWYRSPPPPFIFRMKEQRAIRQFCD